MNAQKLPLAEMTTEQLQSELDLVRAEIEKIKHIGKGSGMTARYWGLAGREHTLNNMIAARNRFNSRERSDKFSDSPENK